MNKIKIITDTCSSLSKNELQSLGVDYVQSGFVLNDQEFKAFEYPENQFEKFYNDLQNIESCSTSCVNTQDFYDTFIKNINDGYDIIFIGLSSGLSSTYNNAKSVADQINKQYGKRIYIADSLTGSFSVAMMVEKTISMVNDGYRIDEIYNAINENHMKTCVLFLPSDLKFLYKSGRINRLQASIGNLLNIVPIITADENGKLKIISKCIGFKKAIKTLQSFILEKADLTSKEKIYIGHTGKIDEAQNLLDFLNSTTKNKDIVIGNIDYTMGCCCGPKTLAVFITLK